MARFSVRLPANRARLTDSEANRKESCHRRQSKVSPKVPMTNQSVAPNTALLRSYDRADHLKMLKKAASATTVHSD